MNSLVLQRLLLMRGLRAFADGYVSLLLPLHLLALGMSPLQVGITATGDFAWIERVDPKCRSIC